MDQGWLRLTTPRLELRPFADADASELLRLFQNPDEGEAGTGFFFIDRVTWLSSEAREGTPSM